MKGVILDLDGVLKRGADSIPGSVEAVDILIEKGIKIAYLTNNSTRTRNEVQRSLMDLGYPEAPVITSAYGASRYIKEKIGRSRCLVIGERGLIRELEQGGHEAVPAGEGRGIRSIGSAPWFWKGGEDLTDVEVDVVVAGLDRTFTYTKLADALWAIRNGADLIATNDDPTLPWEHGKVLPGAGTMIRPLEESSGITAAIVGKPNPYTTYLAAMELELDTKDILMVGDRPDTDIAAGRNAGCRTAMVLTGDVEDPKDRGLEVFKDLKDLVDELF